jgi:hypothetical protein
MPERLPKTEDETNTILGEGQAALWLSESLILALLEANLLNTDTILEAIDIVIAAKKAKAAGSETDVSRAAVTQLASISASIAAAKVSVEPAEEAEPAEEERNRGERNKPST